MILCNWAVYNKESNTYLYTPVQLENSLSSFLFFSTTKWCMGDCPLGKGVCLCWWLLDHNADLTFALFLQIIVIDKY